MAPTLELTKKRRMRIKGYKKQAKLLVRLLGELEDPKTFKLYASGKEEIRRGGKGIPAEEFLQSLELK